MKLEALLNQVVPGLGYELVDFEFTPAKIIRVFIDKVDGITIDDCEIVSNHLNKLFFVEEVNYNRLEVSSPGIERPLKKLDDFKRFIGKLAKIKTRDLLNEQKVFQGIIFDVQNENITLLLDKQVKQDIEFTNISKARLIFEYKQDLRNKTKKGNKK